MKNVCTDLFKFKKWSFQVKDELKCTPRIFDWRKKDDEKVDGNNEDDNVDGNNEGACTDENDNYTLLKNGIFWKAE